MENEKIKKNEPKAEPFDPAAGPSEPDLDSVIASVNEAIDASAGEPAAPEISEASEAPESPDASAKPEPPKTKRSAKTEGKAKAPAKKRSRKQKRRAVKIGFVVSLSVILLLLIGAAVAAVVKGHQILTSDRTLPNVMIGEVAVGDMTKEEVAQTLLDNGWDEEHGGTLTVRLPAEIEFDLDYYEAGVSFTAQQMADFAYQYGHDGSDMQALAAWLDGMSNLVDVSDQELVINEDYIRQKTEDGAARFEVRTALGDYKVDEKKSVMTMLKGGGQMTVDRDALLEQVTRSLLRHDSELNCSFAREAVTAPDFEKLYEQLHVEPKDAYYDSVNNVIIPEVEGFTFDPKEALRLWKEAETADVVTIPVTFLHPKLTASELNDLLFRDLLGDCTTRFRGSTGERINNIALVAQKVDGLILLPGEQFSFNGFIGQRTQEAGFMVAGAYDNGKVVYEIGGGICQTSSTLYNAVLKANLQVDDRTCHYFEVTYLPRGLDATVSWPKPDFAFTNNRDYPIKILAFCDREERSLTFEIWGSNIDGTYVIPRSIWWHYYDDNYPDVQIGYKALSYRDLYDKDGNLIEETEEAYSTYYFHEEDIRWPDPTPAPTKKPVETPKPAETPKPVETPKPIETPEPTPVPPPDPTPEPPPDPTPEPPPDPTPEPPPDPGPGEDDPGGLYRVQ